MRKTFLCLLASLSSSLLHAQPMKIGDINSYRQYPAHLEPYRKGWRLAQETINAAGGVDGRRIEVLSRDDDGRSDTAVRLAAALATRKKVDALMGGFTANVSVALAEYAGRQKIVFVASGALTDELVGEHGNRYTFRLRTSAAVQASMLLPEALKLNKRRWAIVYAHNAHDYAAVKDFRNRLIKAQPSVDFVYEQAVPLGHIDAWGVVHWLEDNDVQAVFSTLFGADLRDFVAEGNARGLFKRVEVLNLLAGQPEERALLKGAALEGWWVTGYPEDIDYGPHRQFLAQYMKRWGEPPRAGSVLGYTALLSIAQAARRAKSSQTEKLVEGLEGLQLATPLGMIEWRKSDHQSTMGTFVGRLGHNGKEPVMLHWRYEGTVHHLPRESGSGAPKSHGH